MGLRGHHLYGKTCLQAADTSAEANAGLSDTAGGKRGRGGVKKLKPYTPAKMVGSISSPV